LYALLDEDWGGAAPRALPARPMLVH